MSSRTRSGRSVRAIVVDRNATPTPTHLLADECEAEAAARGPGGDLRCESVAEDLLGQRGVDPGAGVADANTELAVDDVE